MVDVNPPQKLIPSVTAGSTGVDLDVVPELIKSSGEFFPVTANGSDAILAV
jgi:hypothetical protein